MPNCVRSLGRLETLSIVECRNLMSIKHPPCTLRGLYAWRYHGPSDVPLLQRIIFDPDMCPIININVYPYSLRPWSFEIEGMVKIQPLEGVEEKVLYSLGWTNLQFLNKRHVGTLEHYREKEQFQIQMYYEFGIFSTICGGQAMPDWIMSISSQTPRLFTIPSSSNQQLRGLNFCYVQRRMWYGKSPLLFRDLGFQPDRLFQFPAIKISNETKNRTWIYKHCTQKIDVGGEWLTFISHWMFGMNEMEAGDLIIITIIGNHPEQLTENCGVSIVYEDEDGKMEDKKEDALEYYKSWNHIIGGDLSSFQSTTGEYLLNRPGFTQDGEKPVMFFGWKSHKRCP